MDILRSIGAIVGGYATMIVLVMLSMVPAARIFGFKMSRDGPPPTPTRPYLIYNLVTGLVAAFVGGWVCVWIAGRQSMIHAGVLAGVVALFGLMMARKPMPGQPRWYPLTIAAIGVVGVLAGGCLGAGCLRL